MDIHDISGVNIIETIEPPVNILIAFFIIAILFLLISMIVFVYMLIDKEHFVVHGGMLMICLVASTIFIYPVATNDTKVKYEVYLDKDADYNILFFNYEIIKQKENGFVVIPKDNNKADKYILEHESD